MNISMNTMNLLLLGAGGREHALAWKLSSSPFCDNLFIAPGNAGTASCGKNIDLQATDFEGIGKFCFDNKIDMVIVGPEEPLVKGIVDHFLSNEKLKSIPVIGPDAQGAQLEGSKAFSKKFMNRHGIPTASYREFTAENFEEGIDYLQSHPLPVVLKADGLAAGKGVIISNNTGEAIAEFREMIQNSKFGEAGKKVVIEEFLEGIELSVFALTDGKNYVILPEAKDYKRIGEGDTGNNTGGMGAVSPVPFAGNTFMQKVEERIIRPTVVGLKEEKIRYTGFIFFGLIKVGDEPFVIEYNCRMGDPETEVVIPRLQNDLVELFKATAEQKLDEVEIKQDPRVACTVMAVSGGYPGDYRKGFEISGLPEKGNATMVFHAGTTLKDGKIITNGGRVLAVTSYGETIEDAVKKSGATLKEITFEGIYYRKDIGFEFMNAHS